MYEAPIQYHRWQKLGDQKKKNKAKQNNSQKDHTPEIMVRLFKSQLSHAIVNLQVHQM